MSIISKKRRIRKIDGESDEGDVSEVVAMEAAAKED